MFNDSSDKSTLRRAGVVLLLLGAVAIALTVATHAGGSSDSKSGPQVQTISIPVEGMSCVSCAARVKRALKRIDGVEQVEVSLERREATVRFRPDKVSPDRLKAAIDVLGYKAGQPRVVEGK